MEWLQHGQGSTGIRDTGTPVCSKIAGCPPPDPHVRLGGFGVFQGPITPESLRKALRNDLERLGRLTGAILGRLGTETPQNLPSWHEGRGGGILQFCYKQEYDCWNSVSRWDFCRLFLPRPDTVLALPQIDNQRHSRKSNFHSEYSSCLSKW